MKLGRMVEAAALWKVTDFLLSRRRRVLLQRRRRRRSLAGLLSLAGAGLGALFLSRRRRRVEPLIAVEEVLVFTADSGLGEKLPFEERPR